MRLLSVLLLSLATLSAGAGTADQCLDHDYAMKNYKDCCAKGGYKVEGRGVVCKEVGPKVKAKRELR